MRPSSRSRFAGLAAAILVIGAASAAMSFSMPPIIPITGSSGSFAVQGVSMGSAAWLNGLLAPGERVELLDGGGLAYHLSDDGFLTFPAGTSSLEADRAEEWASFLRDDQPYALYRLLAAVGVVFAMLALFVLGRSRMPGGLLVLAAAAVSPAAGVLLAAPLGSLAWTAPLWILAWRQGWHRLLAGLALGALVFHLALTVGLPPPPLDARDAIVCLPGLLAVLILLSIELPSAITVALARGRAGDRRPFPLRLAAALLPGADALRAELAEHERAELASDIHNTLLPRLASAASATDKASPAAAEAIRKAADGLRELMEDRLPIVLEACGLAEALTELAGHARDQVSAAVELDIDDIGRPGQAVEHAVYRIAEAALDNAVRHSGAGLVTMTGRFDIGFARLVIEDDGAGLSTDDMSAAVRSGHLGLVEMRTRAESIGARLSIDSLVGRGTRIEVGWPA